MFRDYRPFQFFLVFSVFSFIIALGFGSTVLDHALMSGKIIDYSDFILSILFLLISIQFLIAGFVASSIRYHNKELINEVRKSRRLYLK